MTRDFLCRIICVLMWIPQGAIVLFFLRTMLTPTENTPRRRRLLYLWLFYTLLSAPTHYFVRNPVLITLQNVTVLLFSGYLAFTCYSDHPIKKALAVILVMAAPVVADMLTSNIYFLLLDKAPSYGLYAQMDFDWVLLSVSTLVIGIVMQGIVSLFWCRVVKRQRTISYAAYLIAFLFLCISLFSVNVWGAPTADSIPGSIYFVVYFCIFLTLCSFVFVLASQAEKESIARELEEINLLSQLERIHYTAIEERREEMARIRHDYNNVLTSVMYLLRSGACQEAAGLLSDLSQRISDTHEPAFCPIPVVNAVLLEKQRQCQSRGIPLHIQLQLPSQLSIPELELFSAFNNLLDQAMALCNPHASQGITLFCRVTQGYLVFKCTTPISGMPAGAVCDPKILKDLAARHQGDFFTEQKAAHFTAQLSLRLDA